MSWLDFLYLRQIENFDVGVCYCMSGVGLIFAERKISLIGVKQCLSQDLETGCLKLAVVKFWGVQIYTIYLYFNHKHV